MRKIRVIFDIENWHWKSNFGTFWYLPINSILKIQSFPFSMLILSQKIFLIWFSPLENSKPRIAILHTLVCADAPVKKRQFAMEICEMKSPVKHFFLIVGKLHMMMSWRCLLLHCVRMVIKTIFCYSVRNMNNLHLRRFILFCFSFNWAHLVAVSMQLKNGPKSLVE